jgi:hypothetical protein
MKKYLIAINAFVNSTDAVTPIKLNYISYELLKINISTTTEPSYK